MGGCGQGSRLGIEVNHDISGKGWAQLVLGLGPAGVIKRQQCSQALTNQRILLCFSDRFGRGGAQFSGAPKSGGQFRFRSWLCLSFLMKTEVGGVVKAPAARSRALAADCADVIVGYFSGERWWEARLWSVRTPCLISDPCWRWSAWRAMSAKLVRNWDECWSDRSEGLLVCHLCFSCFGPVFLVKAPCPHNTLYGLLFEKFCIHSLIYLEGTFLYRSVHARQILHHKHCHFKCC